MNFIRSLFYFLGLKKRNELLENEISKRNLDDFFLLQIGACDGKSFDPVYDCITKYGINGLLLEPIPERYNELVKTYKGFNTISTLNKALNYENGLVDMVTISEEGIKKLPKWAKGISTIKKDKNSIGDEYWINGKGKSLKNKDAIFNLIKKYRKTISVESISFSSLLKDYDINKIDLLQIDAEGFDYEIIKMIDFNKIKPEIIHFEFANLTDLEKSECELLLVNNGYKTNFYNNQDMLAILEH